MKLLLTGASGLIGTKLASSLASKGIELVRFDCRLIGREGRILDVRDVQLVEEALDGCDGVVHLAAVSRVVWAERDPALCHQINVESTRTLYKAVSASRKRPFVLFASSREVYGRPHRLPTTEDVPLHPLNVYGRSKCEGERLTRELGEYGLRVAVVRFSNVYGWTGDHKDRVIPAFARQAAINGKIFVEGPDCLFDFTHVDDVVPALERTIDALAAGHQIPPLHFTSGVGTTLGELATLAYTASNGRLSIEERPPRCFDVDRFVGDPRRAMSVVDWSPRTDLRTGFLRLVQEFQNAA